MHDSEPDTFDLKTIPETYSDLLRKIGVDSVVKDIGTDDVEKGDYYSRHFTNSPRMITNKGCIDISNSNIDIVHLIQKG